GMLGGDLGGGALERKAGAGRTQSVIRLVTALVEDGEDLVADELGDFTVELLTDQRGQASEVRDQHRVDLGGAALFRERCEADEVSEQHADLLAAAQR